MERFFFKKLITSILIVLIIFGLSIINLINNYKPIIDTVEAQKDISISNRIKNIDASIKDNTYGKYAFIDFYGYLQKLMDKNEESNFEVVKDDNGTLHYTFFGDKANPVYELVKRTEALKNGLKDESVKFAYIMPPDKYYKGYTSLSYGIPYNYANETADSFLDLLKQNNIETIDLRENLAESGIEPKDLFFKTDHHWKTETAFWEFGQLANTLKNKYGANIEDIDFYTNKDNYNFITYKDSYVGSMGRKTGIPYSGVDDFTLIYPKFNTDYTYYSKTGEQETNLNGRFEEALITISPFRTNKGVYALEGDKYSSYLFGNQGIVHVVNKKVPNGPKILFVKDSYTVALAAFLSTVCSDIYMVDPRYYTGSIPEYIDSVKTDFVFVSFYPQDLTEDFFKFYDK